MKLDNNNAKNAATYAKVALMKMNVQVVKINQEKVVSVLANLVLLNKKANVSNVKKIVKVVLVLMNVQFVLKVYLEQDLIVNVWKVITNKLVGLNAINVKINALHVKMQIYV